MNKKAISISLIAISFFMAGCSSNKTTNPTSTKTSTQAKKADNSEVASSQKKADSNENKDTAQSSNQSVVAYGLTENVYKNKNITVNYPQITNLGNNNKQSAINNLIKNDVVTYVNKNIAGDSSLKLNYSVKLQTPELLSIEYFGVASAPNTAHPNNIFYTTNMDVRNVRKLRLPDIARVDENLVNAFKKGQYVSLEPKNSDLQSGVTEYVSDISTSDLIKYFNQADNFDINQNPSSVFSYLTKDSIVISINVSHALGDHAEFSINYKNIQSNINVKDSVLKKLINN